MRTPSIPGILSTVRWIVMVALMGCPGPSPTVDDAGTPDGFVQSTIHTTVRTVVEGTTVRDVLTNGDVEITELHIGIDRLEWKSDVGGELFMDQQQSVDLLGEDTTLTMQLPPGRYSEVEFYLADGPWGAVARAEIAGVGSVVVDEAFEIDARCDRPLEVGVAQAVDVTVEIDGEVLLDSFEEVSDSPSEQLREALKDAIQVHCP